MAKKQLDNKIPLEIERKFLLKKLPAFDKNVQVLKITQFYINVDSDTVRYRRVYNNEKKDGKKISYYRTVKKPIRKGVFFEDETKINESKFVADLASVPKRKVLEKIRFVYKYKGLKFEVDDYYGVSLITLEVELSDIKQEIEFPQCIQKEILLEVTGKKAFSNHNLADEHKGKVNC